MILYLIDCANAHLVLDHRLFFSLHFGISIMYILDTVLMTSLKSMECDASINPIR